MNPNIDIGFKSYICLQRQPCLNKQSVFFFYITNRLTTFFILCPFYSLFYQDIFGRKLRSLRQNAFIFRVCIRIGPQNDKQIYVILIKELSSSYNNIIIHILEHSFSIKKKRIFLNDKKIFWQNTYYKN